MEKIQAFTAIQWLAIFSAVSAVAAAVLSVISARVEIRDNMDEIVNDLRKQGRWAQWTAMANVVATAALVISMVFEWK